jgi:hypothetical protein
MSSQELDLDNDEDTKFEIKMKGYDTFTYSWGMDSGELFTTGVDSEEWKKSQDNYFCSKYEVDVTLDDPFMAQEGIFPAYQQAKGRDIEIPEANECKKNDKASHIPVKGANGKKYKKFKELLESGELRRLVDELVEIGKARNMTKHIRGYKWLIIVNEYIKGLDDSAIMAIYINGTGDGYFTKGTHFKDNLEKKFNRSYVIHHEILLINLLGQTVYSRLKQKVYIFRQEQFLGPEIITLWDYLGLSLRELNEYKCLTGSDIEKVLKDHPYNILGHLDTQIFDFLIQEIKSNTKRLKVDLKYNKQAITFVVLSVLFVTRLLKDRAENLKKKPRCFMKVKAKQKLYRAYKSETQRSIFLQGSTTISHKVGSDEVHKLLDNGTTVAEEMVNYENAVIMFLIFVALMYLRLEIITWILVEYSAFYIDCYFLPYRLTIHNINI